jgi:hypothetical protein
MFSFLATFFGCASAKAVGENYANINYSDGISKKEAKAIAQNYIRSNKDILDKLDPLLLGLGRVETSEACDCWAVGFDAKLNVIIKEGKKWYAVHINKTTGAIEYTRWGPCEKTENVPGTK